MSWKFNPFTGKLDYFEDSTAAALPSIDNNYVVDIRKLTATEETNKQLVLTQTPTSPDNVTMDISGGTSQAFGDDFTVIGNIVSWNGLTLETVLTENDVIRIIYVL